MLARSGCWEASCRLGQRDRGLGGSSADPGLTASLHVPARGDHGRSRDLGRGDWSDHSVAPDRSASPTHFLYSAHPGPLPTHHTVGRRTVILLRAGAGRDAQPEATAGHHLQLPVPLWSDRVRGHRRVSATGSAFASAAGSREARARLQEGRGNRDSGLV
jgi:hypothetical protein